MADLSEIRHDIKKLSQDIERCDTAVPREIFDQTSKLYDSLNIGEITSNEFSGEYVRLRTLVERYQGICKCIRKI